MMENRRVLSIIFDLDNTLIDTAGAGRVAIQKVCEVLKSTSVPESHITDICELFLQKLFHGTFDPSEGRTINEVRIHQWYEALQEVLGTDPDLAMASSCYYTWKNTRLQALTLSPEIRSLLEELKKNYKLLLLTNGDAQTQRDKIEATRCEGLFSAVVVGGEHPEQKPALSIFSHCFESLGVQPHDCIMVGDSLSTDIQGGINAGVKATVWINSDGKSLPPGSVTPDYTLPSVLNLTDVLAQLT
ncbi:N-acylneuraminate-9-phosphatase-like [Myxocyprinus asiaticus]|uniref:N-acylneuraminate-9-phosphatase-like n=1 Tax=Myxocyprinus asiaticus TaxID=70543 RepID=UPI0022230AC5|nr:N-acylneuraminate-9-phosphatase-like [Myxocyprinus asiaticus]XP_051503681.1 N-acylneuraminate-9-phosphatase-like [Myxocyprinus asiaticus]